MGNCFAVKAIDNVEPIIQRIKEETEQVENFKIVITGVSNTGKKTIASKIRCLPKVSVEITKPWIWMKPTPDLYIIGSVQLSSISDNRIMYARDFISRCSIHSMMEVFGVTFFNEPDVILRKIDEKKSVAATVLFQRLESGQTLFYTAPPAVFVSQKEFEEKTSDIQKQQFLIFSKPFDQYEQFFVCIGSGITCQINEELIPALHHLASKNENSKSQKEEDIDE